MHSYAPSPSRVLSVCQSLRKDWVWSPCFTEQCSRWVLHAQDKHRLLQLWVILTYVCCGRMVACMLCEVRGVYQQQSVFVSLGGTSVHRWSLSRSAVSMVTQGKHQYVSLQTLHACTILVCVYIVAETTTLVRFMLRARALWTMSESLWENWSLNCPRYLHCSCSAVQCGICLLCVCLRVCLSHSPPPFVLPGSQWWEDTGLLEGVSPKSPLFVCLPSGEPLELYIHIYAGMWNTYILLIVCDDSCVGLLTVQWVLSSITAGSPMYNVHIYYCLNAIVTHSLVC